MKMKLVLTKKANPANMRESQKRALVLTMQRIAGPHLKQMSIEEVMKAARVPKREALQFKKKVRVLRREGLIQTRAA